MKYTDEALKAIAVKLRAMPSIEKKEPEHSKQEAVRILAKEIQAMQKRGYSLDQISETLRGVGLAVATPTLKSYLQRAKPARKSTQKVDTPSSSPTVSNPVDASKATFVPKPDSPQI
jgi:hypothetical protein